MEPFEYVSVLSSIIIGLGITQILSGISSLILVGKKVRYHVPHLFWIILVFGFHLQEWWIGYGYSRVIESWHLMEFLMIVIYPIILFIMARMLFPNIRQGKEIDLESYFSRNYRRIFAVGLMLPLLSVPQNIFILDYPLQSQLAPIILGILFMVGIALRKYNHIFHMTFSITAFLAGLAYLIWVDPVL